MRIALTILLLTLPCLAVDFKVARSGTGLNVTTKTPAPEVEVVITDIKGNVVRETIGGTRRKANLIVRFLDFPCGHYEVCVRADPMNPKTGPVPTCKSVIVDVKSVTPRMPIKRVKPKKPSKKLLSFMRARVEAVKKPPMPTQ